MADRRDFTSKTRKEALRRSGKRCEAVGGCDKGVFRRNLCAMHYSRLLRHGTTDRSALLKAPSGEMLEWLTAHAGHMDRGACLTFPFPRQPSGYGRLTLDGRRVGAHHAMCRIVHGDPPSSKHEAAHSCGKGHEGCVNPHHIRWATRSENLADRVLHCGGNRGSRHGNSKLTDDIVRLIRKSLSLGYSQASIAARFHVQQTTVSKIKRGALWGWLDGE